MTLVAFATYGTDRAEFITDTVSYTRRVSSLGRSTKHLAIPHLDAAVITQGNSNFAVAAKTGLLALSNLVTDFDELADQAPDSLRALRRSAIELGDVRDDDEAIVFLLGWSDRDAKFRAYEMPTEHDFAPTKSLGLHIIPSPWRIRPSRIELERFRHHMGYLTDLDKLVKAWTSWPAQPAPRSISEWVDLATTVREQRALDGFFQTIVAGNVFHTILRRGSVETRKIHTFNDTGDELAKMLEGTEHPIGLAQDCGCGSGRSFGDCHAGRAPCGCRSGKPFRDCHMVTDRGSDHPVALTLT